MLVIGINDTHDASACLIKDGKIIDVVQEERLTRNKGTSSLPIESIKYIIKKNEIKTNDIDQVCVANKNLLNLTLWNINSQFSTLDWFKLQENYYFQRIFNKKKILLRKIFPNYKPIKLGYSLKNIPFISTDEAKKKNYKDIYILRLNTICDLLNINAKKVSFYDHHQCHAFYGYFTNPNKKNNIAILTADGGGDGVYNTVSLFKNGKYKLFSRSRNNWIGKAYTAVTLYLGLNPFRHLYKVMGLAPYANKKNYNEILNFFLDFLKVKNIDFKVTPKAKDTYFFFRENLKHYRFDNIAGALQEFVEIRLVEWFKNVGKKLKTKNFVFSGGVANNVKVNQILGKQKFVKNLWIPPGPGDESLCMGAAYSYIYNVLGPKKTEKYVKIPKNVYWGPDINEKDIIDFKKDKLIKKNFKFVKDKGYKSTAKLLAKGEIIFVCIGRQEFGQRALGHRSIICDPSNLDLVKKINSTIKMRDFWMPFTPSILDTHIEKYIKLNPKLDINYMTACLDSTSLGRYHLKAAMHQADYTIRPQIVKKTTCQKYYELINSFCKLSGVGAVLNTSLNMHEFPIVTKPLDIVNEIIKDNKNIDFNILIEDNLFLRKKT